MSMVAFVLASSSRQGKLHKAKTLKPEQLALVETLGIGCHAVQRGNPQPGQTVLTIGAGPIGLAVLEFIRLSGARSIVMDMNEQRLEFLSRKNGSRRKRSYFEGTNRKSID